MGSYVPLDLGEEASGYVPVSAPGDAFGSDKAALLGAPHQQHASSAAYAPAALSQAPGRPPLPIGQPLVGSGHPSEHAAAYAGYAGAYGAPESGAPPPTGATPPDAAAAWDAMRPVVMMFLVVSCFGVVVGVFAGFPGILIGIIASAMCIAGASMVLCPCCYSGPSLTVPVRSVLLTGTAGAVLDFSLAVAYWAFMLACSSQAGGCYGQSVLGTVWYTAHGAVCAYVAVRSRDVERMMTPVTSGLVAY